MAFRAAFIGINRHEDPGIPELTGAVRDAQALHALFSDTFADLHAQLLVDSGATIEAVRATIDDCLVGAGEDDIVVLFFAGHGANSHHLVAYDTDRDTIGTSALPMEELAAKFQQSRAQAVLCILDCCFSGAAPARVLEGAPVSRASSVDYAAFRGKGRFLLAAASPTQPSWEEPSSGHGLLTRAIIEVLTDSTVPIDITIAVGKIISRTQALAAAIGEKQDPTFVGGVEGSLEIRPLVRGTGWNKLFPDIASISVTGPMSDLAPFGFPAEVIRQWDTRFGGGLNELQLEAVNRHRVLNGQSLLVVAPTSSGKTFIGELCAVRASLDGRKSVFLLPYRALVNEKYEDFSATYSPIGLRIIRCAGDFTDETGLFISGKYDLAILTYETFLALAVGNPHLVKRIGLVVIDEAQFITDPNRGIVVELLLTFLLAARAQGVRSQFVGLSAVIGDINEFDTWLGCNRLVWTRRPVPLVEGVLDRSGTFQALDANGNETESQLLPERAIQQRKKEPSAQDVIVPLAQALITAKEKLLIFRNTRGPAEGCARYLAQELGLPPATAALAALSPHDPSSSAAALQECLAGGTAFHNSNLRREERIVVERFFRDPAGGINALAATTTLAAGINTPASTVILAEQEFVGEDGRPFTIAEYKNMAGRAGRLGFNEVGKAIILAETAWDRRQLFTRYVRGTPEPISSSFTNEDFRTWVIRLLSQVKAIPESEVPSLLAGTYGGFLAQRNNQGWRAETERRIAEIVAQFVQLGLLERHDHHVQLSLLGRACGQSSLSFDSAMRLIETVKDIPPQELSAFRLVALLQVLPEADAQYTPVRKKARTESARIGDATVRFGHAIIHALQKWAGDEVRFWARCKRAAIIADWMSGVSIQEIERRYTVPFGGQVQLGDIQRFSESTRFHIRSAHQILSALLSMDSAKEAEFEVVLQQLEYGVPADAVDLTGSPFGFSRGECLAMIARGIKSKEALKGAHGDVLEDILGRARARQVKAIIGGT